MDNASDYGSEDSRFESWQARKPDFESNMMQENKSTCHALSMPHTSQINKGGILKENPEIKEAPWHFQSTKVSHFSTFECIFALFLFLKKSSSGKEEWHRYMLSSNCLLDASISINACINKKTDLAERGFDPRTSGLWAQHASTAPLCWLCGTELLEFVLDDSLTA